MKPFFNDIASSHLSFEQVQADNWARIQPRGVFEVREPAIPSVAAMFRTECSRRVSYSASKDNAMKDERTTSPVDDIAQVAAFLCSDQSAYMTGQVLNVDGGILMP